jgi:pyruvate dehydrogenase E2 component (dihydrolipoamide acetyltransferase)
MAHPVIMPKFGFTQESSEIVRWLKKPGEAVEKGDAIVEVSTDKVNMEVEATATGILDGVRYQEGDTVPVTEIIAYIRASDESPLTVESAGAGVAERASTTGKTTEVRATPVAANLAREHGVDLSLVAGTGPGGQIAKRDVEEFLATRATGTSPSGKVPAVPAARRLARELDIDITRIQGTGPRGRVQTPDVQAAKMRQPQVTAMPSAVPGSNVLKMIPLEGMRLTIATRMQKSAQEAPHIVFEVDIDVTVAESLRTRANQHLKENQPHISLTAIIAKTCAWALKRHPLVNSRLDGNQILLLSDANIGIATALEEGLIVPVVHSAERKSIAEIAGEIRELVDRARNNRLRPDDVMDGTFTISNLGMFGIDRFTAIINPPQTAILAVGRVTKRIVPDEEDHPVVRPMMTVTLSADHRVIDGAIAARFLSDVREALEHPGLLAI